jgi:hypothetical protein
MLDDARAADVECVDVAERVLRPPADRGGCCATCDEDIGGGRGVMTLVEEEDG